MDYDRNSFGNLESDYSPSDFVRESIDDIEKGSSLSQYPLESRYLRYQQHRQGVGARETAQVSFYSQPVVSTAGVLMITTMTMRPQVPHTRKSLDRHMSQQREMETSTERRVRRCYHDITKTESIGKRDDNVTGEYTNLENPRMEDYEIDNDTYKYIAPYDYVANRIPCGTYRLITYRTRSGDPVHDKYDNTLKFVREKAQQEGWIPQLH